MDLTVDRDMHYEVVALIGEGSFGRVFKARHVATNTIVALKVISKVNRSAEELQMLRSEFKIQRQLDHVNIVKMIDSYETDTELVAVTEYLPNELHRLFGLHKHRLPEPRVQSLALHLFNALFYLHSHRILHRDLKPQNVLLSSEGIAKVCDFGFARILSTKTLVLTSIKGTPLYMAPEIIEEQPYDQSADLWSLGCILYELAVGKPPFNTKSLFELINKVRDEDIKWPEHLSETCKSFLQGLLEKDPRRRFSWSHVLSHDFIRCSTTDGKGQSSIENMRLSSSSSLRRSSLTEPLSASQELEKELQREQKKSKQRSLGTLMQMAKKHDEDKKLRDAVLKVKLDKGSTGGRSSVTKNAVDEDRSNAMTESTSHPPESHRAVFDVVDYDDDDDDCDDDDQDDDEWVCLMNFLQGEEKAASELLSNSRFLRNLLRRLLRNIASITNDNETDSNKKETNVENAISCLILPFVSLSQDNQTGMLSSVLKCYSEADVLGSLLRICELTTTLTSTLRSTQIRSWLLMTTSLITRLLYTDNVVFADRLEQYLNGDEALLLRFLKADNEISQPLLTWLCRVAFLRRDTKSALFSTKVVKAIKDGVTEAGEPETNTESQRQLLLKFLESL